MTSNVTSKYFNTSSEDLETYLHSTVNRKIIRNISYSNCIPRFYIYRKTIAQAMERVNLLALIGEKTLANYGEGNIAMAVAEGMYCLRQITRENIDELYLAAITASYIEREIVGIIASNLKLTRRELNLSF